MTSLFQFLVCHRPRHLAATLIASCIGILACSSSPVAPFLVKYQVPVEGPKVVFLAASEQDDRIAEALRAAGFEVAPKWKTGEYKLRVDVGGVRANRDCGSSNNIRYLLLQQGQRNSEGLQLKGRGWTGTCDPNIFDAMSEKLASYFP